MIGNVEEYRLLKKKIKNMRINNTSFINEASEEIYLQTYKFHGDEERKSDIDINDTHFRVANDLAKNESDKEKITDDFMSILENFAFMPGGRITSNAGTGLKGTTYINCFTPEVEVLTKDGYKQIVDIKVGDEVLTHNGRWKKVKSTMFREYDGEIDVYKSSVLSSSIRSTPEHPFYQGGNKWEISSKNNKLVLLKYEPTKSSLMLDILEYVKDIKRVDGKDIDLFFDDDIIHTTSKHNFYNGSVCTKESKSINRIIKIDENVSYSFGRFVGDGSTFNVNKNYEVDGFNIIFSKKEKSELVFIKESLENSFGIDININESENFDGLYLRKNNPIMAKFFREAFGKNSYSKRIPSFIWSAPKNIIESFLLGIFDSDGTVTKKQELRITLSNYKLIKDIQALMNMIGYPGRITETSTKGFKSWKLFINKAIGSQFIKKMNKYYNDDRLVIEKTINNGLSPIINESNNNEKLHLVKNFEKYKEDYKGLVYNISVSEDESYVVNNVIVHNCFVDGFVGESQDSMERILDTLRRQALILKSEGGYGFNSDVMRPRGSYIGGIGNESPGSVEMLDMWDTQSAVITKGSGKKSKKGKQKIRKGAQMVTKSVWHPDIEEYITAKQTENRLTKFNMSILCSDDFMIAVKENKPWNLKFPDYENCKDLYNKEWDGNINLWESKGYPVKIYKTYEDANELWDLISKSTYNRNEPGVLFVDTINRLNNLWYCEYINATNPCGEQILPIGGVCLLGSLNLAQFITDEREFDFDKFKSFIPKAVRLMDNVNDITYVPLESQRQSLKNKRRIGLGVMGYGSALLMMGLRYGSKEALKFTDEMMSCLANTAYQASALLAREKGAFPLYNEEKYLQSNFVKNVLSQETIDLIKKYGIRNSHLLSIQPTGNSSFFGNNVSGGGEPIFLFEYIRTAIQPFAPEGLDVPKNIDFSNKTYESTTEWKWKKEGDENMLWTEFNGQIWKFDKNRGLLKEIKVEDYGLWWLRQRGLWDEKADWAVNAYNLTVADHVNTMGVLAKYLDSAMSKCLVEGTLISTDKGIVKIESFSNNNTPDSFSDVNNEFYVIDENGDKKRILNHYYGGERDSYKVTFNNGFEIECAYTHKFKTEYGWKSILELSEGDKVFFRTNPTSNNNNYIEINNKPSFYNSIKYDFPNYVDEDYAKFIGMLLSDGSINENSIGIVEKNEDVGRESIRLFKKIFNIEPRTSVDKRSGVKYIHLNSRPLVEYYKDYIGKNALEKDIPDDILLSNDSVKLSFLSGLSLDGYIKEDKNLVIYEGYSRNIALKTSYILSSLGYNYYLGKKRVRNGKLSKISYMIKAYLTDKKIETIEIHKNKYSQSGKKQSQFIIKDKKEYEVLPKTNENNYYLYRNLKKSISKSSFVKGELLDKLGIEYDKNLTNVKISKIEYIGKKKVYDIEVEDSHSYLINGIVSHNTINLPQDYPYEDFKDVYFKCWETGVIKGCTTYREGTMAAVLSKDSTTESNENEFKYHHAPKRPKELPCDVFQITAKGKKWTIIVGLYDGKPYECFGIEHAVTEIPENFKKGFLSKEGRGKYTLKNEKYTINDVTSNMTDEEEALTRMISTSLRHGSSIDFIVEQLNKSQGTIVSFNKAIARVLSKYAKELRHEKVTCQECGSTNISFEEGCFKCYECGSSKCGT